MLMQIATAPVLVGATFGIIILASVIPIIRGADLNISGAGPFTQRAEVRTQWLTVGVRLLRGCSVDE